MKKVLSCVLSLALLGASLAAAASAHRLEYIDYSRDAVASRFEDVAGWEWFVPSLGHIGIGYGLIRGSADGEGKVRFYPQRSMTREQFVQVLYRIDEDVIYYDGSSTPNDKGTSGFTDVDASAWYAKSVVWAENEGIAEGVGDGSFGVGAAVSREAVAAMLRRYLTARPYIKLDETGAAADFSDSADISDWAREDVEWAAKRGLFIGDENGSFLPAKELTRAEATELIARFYAALDYDLGYIFDAEHIESMTYETQRQEPNCPPSTITATENNAAVLKHICSSITGGRVVSLEDRVESELCDGAATDRLTIHYSDGREDFKLSVWNSYLYRPLFRALCFEDGVLESALVFDFPAA